MLLVIAEKPSLGRKIQACLEKHLHTKFKSETGFSYSGDIYITSVFGHLFQMCDFKDYNESWSSWSKSYTQLPFQLNGYEDVKFKLNDADGIKERYNLIKKLLKSANAVIHAGDADREGEIIVRNILVQAGYKGEVKRLWLPAQDDASIWEAYQNMQDDGNYDNLAEEGWARTVVDWLYGFNLSRYVSSISGETFKVGRIKVPMVEAIYDREQEIKNFVPETYFMVEAQLEKGGVKYTLSSKKKFKTKTEAEAYVKELNNHPLTVSDVSSSNKLLNPPRLFSLSTAQNRASKLYKYSPDDTLALIQGLYEAGYVTYPRTDTEYMADSEKETVKETINAFHNANLMFRDTKKVFDTSKVESHSALTPTRKTMDIFGAMPVDERQAHIYEMIVRRFMANFWKEDCVLSVLSVLFENGIEQFKLNGKSVLKRGWLAIEENELKDTLIPTFLKGENIVPNFVVVDKQTQPKKYYTVETFNNFLETPFREETTKAKTDEEYRALLDGLSIGTVATRATTIAELIKDKYIRLEKSSYRIEEKGVHMIETIRSHKINMSKNKTIELGGYLKDVYKGTKAIDDVIDIANNELSSICDTSVPMVERSFSKTIDAVCDCPKCKTGKIIRTKTKTGKTMYYCSNFKAENPCSFVMYNPMRYYQNEIPLTDAKVKKLCEGKAITGTVKTFRGTDRKAKLALTFNGNYVNLKEEK